MDSTTLTALIESIAGLVQTGVTLYEDSKSTLSETDTAAIEANLAKAQAATAAYRPQVDAALDAAALRI